MGRIDHLLLRWGHRSLLLATGVWVLVFAGMFAGLWRVRWHWGLSVLATVVLAAIIIQWSNAVRERFVREAALPRFLQRKLRETYPHLSPKDCELAERGLRWTDVDSTFYSDSMNDVPLLEKVDHPVATNPDPRLRALASQRGWRILDLFPPHP